ncbi:MAG: hypothetical protein LBL94_02740 [Prevotellaceae bacterium]|jgi:hypothetical protein|nr:hypothetical protein [Prevotellaceae bacterium]
MTKKFQRKMRETNVEKERVKAYRDVGVAWAEHQQQTVVYTSFWQVFLSAIPKGIAVKPS